MRGKFPPTYNNLAKIVIEKCNKRIWVSLRSEHLTFAPSLNFVGPRHCTTERRNSHKTVLKVPECKLYIRKRSFIQTFYFDCAGACVHSCALFWKPRSTRFARIEWQTARPKQDLSQSLKWLSYALKGHEHCDFRMAGQGTDQCEFGNKQTAESADSDYIRKYLQIRGRWLRVMVPWAGAGAGGRGWRSLVVSEDFTSFKLKSTIPGDPASCFLKRRASVNLCNWSHKIPYYLCHRRHNRWSRLKSHQGSWDVMWFETFRRPPPCP